MCSINLFDGLLVWAGTQTDNVNALMQESDPIWNSRYTADYTHIFMYAAVEWGHIPKMPLRCNKSLSHRVMFAAT